MIQKSFFQIVLISIISVLVLSACGATETPPPTADMNAVFTQVAATIAMEYTQTALAIPTATNTPEPTITPLPSPTQEALIIPSPTLPLPTITPTFAGLASMYTNPATANGCYNAALVEDVTVPAGTDYKPGDSFKKTWRLINTGTCDWTVDFKITYVGGNVFGSDTEKIRQRVAVGNIADITLNMVAPGGSGTVVSNWQMATDTGLLFGSVLTVSIDLPGSTAPTSTAGCYNAALVSDVTIPADTEMDPGDDFTKTWQIKNTGTCDWKQDFRFTFVGGNLFGSDTTKIRKFVKAGDTTNISLKMVAPAGSGTITSSWQMADESGNLFGQVFTIQIVLK